jgi:hypothetical protein
MQSTDKSWLPQPTARQASKTTGGMLKTSGRTNEATLRPDIIDKSRGKKRNL